MGSRLYTEFMRTADDSITNGRWYSIHAAFGLPTNLGYRLHSFGDRDKLSDEEKQVWARAAGIDGFLEYEALGYISHPEPFAAKSATVLVNSLGSLDRFKFADRGSLGDGWYDGSTFLLRLHLDFLQAQQLLSIMKSPEFQVQNEVDMLRDVARDATGYDPCGINIRFDLFNIKYQERHMWTSYEICRIYI